MNSTMGYEEKEEEEQESKRRRVGEGRGEEEWKIVAQEIVVTASPISISIGTDEGEGGEGEEGSVFIGEPIVEEDESGDKDEQEINRRIRLMEYFESFAFRGDEVEEENEYAGAEYLIQKMEEGERRKQGENGKSKDQGEKREDYRPADDIKEEEEQEVHKKKRRRKEIEEAVKRIKLEIMEVKEVDKKERVAVTGYMRKTIAYKQGWLCAYCKDTLPPWYEVDHKLPLWAGGHPTDESNLVAVCKRCHAAKTHKENDLRIRLLWEKKRGKEGNARGILLELAALGGCTDCFCLRCGVLFAQGTVHMCA